jgi:tetratricopeptide (TPR) repeat protein
LDNAGSDNKKLDPKPGSKKETSELKSLSSNKSLSNRESPATNTSSKHKRKTGWLSHFFPETWASELKQIMRGSKKGTLTKEQLFSTVSKLMAQGLTYDAIRLLYELKYYREAADILRGAGATTEAARLYVKAKSWAQAESCFYALGDRMNVARCAKAAGKYAEAAPVFEEHGEWDSAAKCYRSLGNWRYAASLHAKGRNYPEAVRCWHEWIRLDKKAVETKLSSVELNGMIKAISEGKFEAILFQILDNHGQVSSLVFALMKKNRMSMAAEIYDSRFREISADLCAWVKTHPELIPAALSLCQMAGDQRGTANLYEQMDRLQDAVVAYESIGDLKSAYACAVKSEWWGKVNALKEKIGPIASFENPDKNIQEFTKPAPPQEIPSLDIFEGVRLELDLFPDFDIQPFDSPLPELEIVEKSESEGINQREMPTKEHGFGFVESRFFNQLNHHDRHKLWDIGAIVSYKAGDTIVEVGAMPTSTFTLLEGVVEIYKQKGRLEEFVDRIGAGENFGESWLMVNLKSEVRIIAATDCHLHVVERAGLQKLMAQDAASSPNIISQVAQAICFHLLHRFGASKWA